MLANFIQIQERDRRVKEINFILALGKKVVSGGTEDRPTLALPSENRSCILQFCFSC